MSIPKVLAIHDVCGTGRCSLSIAAPVLGVQGLQCCALPTAYFSAPTNTPDYVYHDMGDVLMPALRHWHTLGLRFAAVYSGYLASGAQAQGVALAHTLFPDALRIVDPVMGDNGRLYRRFGEDFCAHMGKLCQNAHLITPNVTEAALLLGKAPSDTPADMDEAQVWAKALGTPRCSVVITGYRPDEARVAVVWWDARSGSGGWTQTPYIPAAYHGTGDLFASVLTGALVRGESLPKAAHKAAGFVYECVSHSAEQNAPVGDGILLEDCLSRLMTDKHPV